MDGGLRDFILIYEAGCGSDAIRLRKQQARFFEGKGMISADHSASIRAQPGSPRGNCFE